VTLLAMRRERRPTRAMLLMIWIRVWCVSAMCCATLWVRRPVFGMQITLSRACDCPFLRVAVTHRSLASGRAVACISLRPLLDVVD